MKVNFELELNQNPETIALLIDLIRSVQTDGVKAEVVESKETKPPKPAKETKPPKEEPKKETKPPKEEPKKETKPPKKEAKPADDDEDLGSDSGEDDSVQEELDADLSEEELRESLKGAVKKFNEKHTREELASLIKMAGGVTEAGKISVAAVPSHAIPKLLKALAD